MVLASETSGTSPVTGGNMADGQEVIEDKTNVAPTQEPKVVDKPQLVEMAKLDHALSDLHKFKTQVKELESKIESKDLQTLKEKEDWQKIAELKEVEADKYKTESTNIKESYLHDKKLSAVREAALKAGARPEAMKFIEGLSLDDILIETTSTGKVNALGADQFVGKFKTENSFMFGNKEAPNLNTSTPKAVFEGEITIDAIMDAHRKKDMVTYNKLYGEYLKQRQTRS